MRPAAREARDRSRALGRVLIVDDNAAFCRAARLLLTAEGCDVVGEAASAAAGLRCTVMLRPDVVLLDVSLPDGSGLELCARLTAIDDRVRIVVISSRDDPGLHAAARDSGAIGFLTKSRLSVKRLAAMLSASGRG